MKGKEAPTVKRANGGSIPRRPGDPVPGTKGPARSGSTAGGLNNLSPPSAAASAPAAPAFRATGISPNTATALKREGLKSGGSTSTTKLARGGFVPFGSGTSSSKKPKSIVKATTAATKSSIARAPKLLPTATKAPGAKNPFAKSPFGKTALDTSSFKAKGGAINPATKTVMTAAKNALLKSSKTNPLPKGQRIDITSKGVVKKYKGGVIAKAKGGVVKKADGGAIDSYVDEAKKLAGSAYGATKSAITDNPITRAGARAREWWDTPAPAEYSEQGQRQGVGLDLETKDVPTVKPPKTAPAPGLAPGYKGKDAPKTDYEGKHDNTYLETFGSKKNIGYNPARRGERTGNWLMDERKGLNYPETIGNVHRFDREMAEGAKKYGTPESESKWRKDASKSGQEYWDLERAERETGRGRGTTGGEKAGERAAYDAKKRKDTPYAKGGAVKKLANGGSASAPANASKRLAAEKLKGGGKVARYAEGGEVGLWERLKAGNIDDPSSEAYRRWGKGATSPDAGRTPAGDADYAALEAAAATPPPEAPVPAVTTPAALKSWETTQPGLQAGEAAGTAQTPRPKAKTPPRAGKAASRGTPKAGSRLAPASAASSATPRRPMDTGPGGPDLGPAIAAAGSPGALGGPDPAMAAAAAAQPTEPPPNMGPAIAAAGGPAGSQPPPNPAMRVGTEMGRPSLPGQSGPRAMGAGGPGFGEAEMYGPTGAGAGRGGLGGMPTAPPTQPTFGLPGSNAAPPTLAMQETLRRLRAMKQAPPPGAQPFAKGGFVKSKVIPATKGTGPAVAAEHTKVPTFAVSKPKPMKARLENDVAKPFGAKHASQWGAGGGDVLAQRSSKPIRKKFI